MIAWSVREFNESHKTAQFVDSLKQWDSAGHIFFHVDYETRFPLVVSQLLNHGKHPWGDTPFFFRVKSGEIQLTLDEFVTADIDQITQLAIDSGYLIKLEVLNFNALRQQMLSKFDGANVYELSIDFNSEEWVYQAISDDDQITDWEEAKELANLKLDLNIKLPRLETLNIGIGLYARPS